MVVIKVFLPISTRSTQPIPDHYSTIPKRTCLGTSRINLDRSSMVGEFGLSGRSSWSGNIALITSTTMLLIALLLRNVTDSNSETVNIKVTDTDLPTGLEFANKPRCNVVLWLEINIVWVQYRCSRRMLHTQESLDGLHFTVIGTVSHSMTF